MLKIIIKIIMQSTIVLVTPSAVAAPIVSQTESNYSVRGNTAQELLAQMKVVGPSVGGAHFDAVTEYYVKWDTTYSDDFGHCQITNASVSLFSNTTLPRWVNYASADASTQQRWDQFMYDIRKHEQGHSNHGLQAALEVEAMIVHLPLMDNCATMQTIVKEKTNAIVSKYKVIDNEYDRLTNHGANQHYA